MPMWKLLPWVAADNLHHSSLECGLLSVSMPIELDEGRLHKPCKSALYRGELFICLALMMQQ